MNSLSNYVVVTPARNEAQYIELTIRSVVAQTLLPRKWMIVSDGSTDRTDEIVKRYSADYPWIELVRMPERQERHFAGKVHAFNAGYAVLQGVDYDVIASLDADISFEPDYFSFLLGKLSGDLSLGLVGTPFKEESNQTYDYRFTSIEHVSGACQVFRRQCFEDIGGYIPVKNGIDHIAVVTARMKGWKTRTFPERVCLHHRPMGTAQRGTLSARFLIGANDYSIGNHPFWELSRSAYQMTKKPYVAGGLAILSGFLWTTIQRPVRPVSKELVRFCRTEQIQRLRRFFTRQGSAPVTMASTHPEKPLNNGPVITRSGAN
jgi:biofilm PGA synthesis N-glycosyltransferase PgaC